MYQIYLNEEQSRSLADTNYHNNLLLAYHAYCIYANMLHHLGTTITSDSTDYLNENQEIFRSNLENISVWARTGEIVKLKWFAGRLSKWESDNGMNVIGTYQIRLAEIREKEDFWNKAYLAIYIVGALILAYAFTIDYRLAQSEK